MTFVELQEALALLGLPERASLQEIKDRFRHLAKRYHPDHGEPEPETMRRLNAAKKILMEYCGNYRFSFSREEFLEQNPEERLREQFAQDGTWRG